MVARCKICQVDLESSNNTLDEKIMLPSLSCSLSASVCFGRPLQQSLSVADFKKRRLVGKGGQGEVYRYRPENGAAACMTAMILSLPGDPDEDTKRAKRGVSVVM